MRTDQVQTIGIMFDDPREPTGFPRVTEVPWEWSHVDLRDVDAFRNWVAICYDPRPLAYGEENRRAMDMTNLAVIVEKLGGWDDIPELDYYASADRWNDSVAECQEHGVAVLGYVIAINPDTIDADIIDELQQCSRALSDYPLLDEEAYSELEHEAWEEYASDGLRVDTMRADELADVDEETRDFIDEAWDEIWSDASMRLHYFEGWHGNHSPAFGLCVAKTIVDALVRTLTR